MSDYSEAMRHEWQGEEQDYANENAAERDSYLEQQAEEVTQMMPTVEQALRNELESLRARIANARCFVIAALSATESGHAMPWAYADSMLTQSLTHLGCADCGQPFEHDDASTLACVRKHGVHAGHCS